MATPKQRVDKLNAYNNKYSREHYAGVMLKFNKETEADAIAWLENKPNKKQAILALIRGAIERGE